MLVSDLVTCSQGHDDSVAAYQLDVATLDTMCVESHIERPST